MKSAPTFSWGTAKRGPAAARLRTEIMAAWEAGDEARLEKLRRAYRVLPLDGTGTYEEDLLLQPSTRAAVATMPASNVEDIGAGLKVKRISYSAEILGLPAAADVYHPRRVEALLLRCGVRTLT